MLQWPVGVIDGPATEEAVAAFVTVHARFAAADPHVQSEFVHTGPPASDDLVAAARRSGVRVRSFVDYQGLIDLRPLLERQTLALANDRVYPAALYVSQRYRVLSGVEAGAVEEDLLDRVVGWLGADAARLVMVLGDFGRGKTSMLRQLARTLPEALPALLPVLVELCSLEKAPSLDELLGQYLIRQRVEDISPAKLRYMIRSGRLALLLDGFDELELRVGYDNAADYLQVLLESVTDRAKVVLTSRTQHFMSNVQVRTALGERISAVAGSRIVVLDDFTFEQILQFLTNIYDGDAAAARARLTLLGEIEDLLGLARNPRMLAFIAQLDEDRLRVIQQGKGRISRPSSTGSWSRPGWSPRWTGNAIRRESGRWTNRSGWPPVPRWPDVSGPPPSPPCRWPTCLRRCRRPSPGSPSVGTASSRPPARSAREAYWCAPTTAPSLSFTSPSWNGS